MKKVHRIIQGDDFAIRVPIVVNGLRYPADGWQNFWFTVKNSVADADADAVLQLTAAAGRIVPHGACSVRIVGVPADTKTVPVGKYVFDIQGKTPGGQIVTLETGTVYIDPEVTVSA